MYTADEHAHCSKAQSQGVKSTAYHKILSVHFGENEAEIRKIFNCKLKRKKISLEKDWSCLAQKARPLASSLLYTTVSIFTWLDTFDLTFDAVSPVPSLYTDQLAIPDILYLLLMKLAHNLTWKLWTHERDSECPLLNTMIFSKTLQNDVNAF